VKYKYRTVDELISSGGKKLTRKEKQSELAKVKVIDMTGKEQRVLSGLVESCVVITVQLLYLVYIWHCHWEVMVC